MALEEIKLWAMDGSGGATQLPFAQQTDTEQELEDVLVKNPEMLMPGLTLVGRQTRTDGGPLDLLGVDRHGRLVVFELKRGTLSRDAVAQVIDYASSLESMDDETLAQHIASYSGHHDIDNIDDFGEWYGENRSGLELSEMRPIRLFLVGLGVDDTTARMVKFLADRNVDISLLTFHGYKYDGKTLLARQVQVEPDSDSSSSSGNNRSRAPQRELIERVENRIKQYEELWGEGYRLWNAAHGMFRELWGNPRQRVSRANREWALHRINFSLRGRAHLGAVQLSHWDEWVEVIFFPDAVRLCLEEFTQLREEIPYFTHPVDDPAKASGVIEVKFKLKSMSEWETYKEKLAAVTRSVYKARLAAGEG